MASNLKKMFSFIFGPDLYQKINNVDEYTPWTVEKWGDRGVRLMHLLVGFGNYAAPLAAIVFYRRGALGWDNMMYFTRILLQATLATSAISYAMRALGRYNNPVYRHFYDTLQKANSDINVSEVKNKLMQYDFDFSHWPVEFTDTSPYTSTFRDPTHPKSFIQSIVYSPCRLVTYIGANYLAIKMVYPGASTILQTLMWSTITEGRVKLIQDFGAERFKIRTRDENDLDIIYVDRRQESHKNPNGGTLVICCEGNCGFYELGIMMTPVEAKYSVLGWNHPGFGGSTGLPFPLQEQNAIEAVMEFAIHKLGYKPENIILYGWSIGGYTSSWAAMKYPSIKGLIVDASFDDILPLALARMPQTLGPLIKQIIRGYINLTVWENVVRYPGPVMFVRRSDDEMITTVEQDVSTNRGNDLVFQVLKHRFPKLIDKNGEKVLRDWLDNAQLNQKLMRDTYNVDVSKCSSILTSYIEENGSSYPMQIGESLNEQDKSQLILFLADNHMKGYRSTHCTPLPVNLFRLPWAPEGNSSLYNKL